MRRLLAARNRTVLVQLARSDSLLAFDFDGTLASIVSDPSAAQMRPRTAGLLERLCALYPCAVISGRSRSDVASRLGAARVKYVIGNHGIEPGGRLLAIEREMARARAVLAPALAEHTDLDLEDKRYTLAVHYRRSRRKRAARAVIQRAVSSVPRPLRIVPGKLVMNILPARSPHKGHALLRLRALEGVGTAAYVGDDVTDEDVFQLDQPGRLLTVRVGPSKMSAAAYALRDQHELDTLLARLIDLRADRLA